MCGRLLTRSHCQSVCCGIITIAGNDQWIFSRCSMLVWSYHTWSSSCSATLMVKLAPHISRFRFFVDIKDLVFQRLSCWLYVLLWRWLISCVLMCLSLYASQKRKLAYTDATGSPGPLPCPSGLREVGQGTRTSMFDCSQVSLSVWLLCHQWLFCLCWYGAITLGHRVNTQTPSSNIFIWKKQNSFSFHQVENCILPNVINDNN